MLSNIKSTSENGQAASSIQNQIIISWTNPQDSEVQTQMIEETRIKQEDELQLISQIIQEVPHPSVVESNEQPHNLVTKNSPKVFNISTKDQKKDTNTVSIPPNVRNPIVKEEFIEEINVKILNLEPSYNFIRKMKENPKINLKTQTANNFSFIKASNQSNTTTTLPDNIKITVMKSPERAENVISDIKSNITTKDHDGICNNSPEIVVSVNLDSDFSCSDDDDDENRLVIKEEEDVFILDILDDKKPASPPTSTYKRPSTSTESENPPKKAKILQDYNSIPKYLQRKYSTSSDSSSSTSNPFQCTLCPSTFKRRIDLIHHAKSHSGAKYQCQRCGLKFKFKGYFIKHVCIACDICEQTFPVQQALRNHQKNVHNKKFEMYQCDICGKEQSYRHGMLYHMSKDHMDFLESKFECDHCGKKFKIKDSLRLHMKNHESVVACNLCGKKVKQANLSVHNKLVHVAERKFECPTCHLNFKTRECLKSHIATHEKNFKCNECGKKFGKKSYLKEHEDWHKNPDIFRCTFCKKAFSQKNCLKSHLKIHSADHRFTKLKCTLCSYSTDKIDNFKKHEMKHKRQEENEELKKNWIQCEKCPMKVKNKLKLATHYWKKHSEIMS